MSFIRLIIIAVIGFLLFRIVKALFVPRTKERRQFHHPGEKKAVSEMVQDPNCGVFVAKKEAYSNQVGGKVLYFCSEKCCKEYLKEN